MTKNEARARSAMKLALEALKFALHVGFDESSESQIKKGDKAVQQHQNAITALREALAEQPAQQKPVADEVRCSMSTQHTPGPWVVKDTDFGAFVYCDHDYPITGPMNARSDGDNARLIAAAPDLIELLQTMPHPERRTGITHLTDEWCEWNAKRRAAIAKAKGIKENT